MDFQIVQIIIQVIEGLKLPDDNGREINDEIYRLDVIDCCTVMYG